VFTRVGSTVAFGIEVFNTFSCDNCGNWFSVDVNRDPEECPYCGAVEKSYPERRIKTVPLTNDK